jgi:hypothetical protein
MIQLAYGFIQFFLLLLLINILFRTILPEISLYTLSIVNIILTLFLIWPLFQREVLINTNFSLSYHAGAFLNSLLAFIIMLRYINTRKLSTLVWFGTVILLAFFSDKIFLIYFPLPVILSFLLFMKSENSNPILMLIGITLFSLLTGWLLFRTLVLNEVFYVTPAPISPDNGRQSFHVAFNQFKSLIENGGLRSYVFGLTFISILFSLISALYYSIIQVQRYFHKSGPGWNAFKFYNIYFSILTLGAISAPIYKGIYYSEWQIRYCIFPVFLGLTNIGIYLDYYLHPSEKALRLLAIFATTVLFLFFIVNYHKYKPFSVFEKVSAYYPGIVKAADNLSLRYPLKNGVGNHWDSKHITGLSKNGVRVYSVFDNLHFWFHGNNKLLALYKDCNKTDTAFFNFVVLRTLGDTAYVCNFFGDKIKRVTQDGFRFYLVPDFYYDRMTGKPVMREKN